MVPPLRLDDDLGAPLAAQVKIPPDIAATSASNDVFPIFPSSSNSREKVGELKNHKEE
jgi:hypothetical protein